MSLTAISSLESAREKKIFHELDVHHVWKEGISFWSQEAEMTPTPISSLDQPEEKIFHELDVHHV